MRNVPIQTSNNPNLAGGKKVYDLHLLSLKPTQIEDTNFGQVCDQICGQVFDLGFEREKAIATVPPFRKKVNTNNNKNKNKKIKKNSKKTKQKKTRTTRYLVI